MEKKERDLKKKLNNINHLIIPKYHIDFNVLQKITKTIESIKETEHHLYTEEPSYGNVLTRMYILSKKIMQASEANSAILSAFPNDITAQYLRIGILAKRQLFSETGKEIETLENVLENEPAGPRFQLCVHKADIAFFLYQIGPAYYVKAIDFYEEAIADLLKLINTPPEVRGLNSNQLEKYVTIWRFRLSVLYNRMMNYGNILAHGQERPDFTRLDIFHKICTLVGNILKSSFQHTQYMARAWLEILYAFQKLRGKMNTATLEYIQRAIGQEELDPKFCIEEAFRLAPDDGSVLEKVGRYYRTHSKSIRDFQQAVNILEKCIRLYPSRHVALHHLSLAYKSMWFLSNEFKEATLYDNPIRTGQKTKSWRNRGKGQHSRGPDVYSQIAQQFGPKSSQNVGVKDSDETEPIQTGPEPSRCQVHFDETYQHYPCATADAGYESLVPNVESNESESIQKSSRNENANAESLSADISEITIVIQTKTVKSKYTGVGGKKPRQYRRPDRFDCLRTSNPMRSESTRDNIYLENAIAALESANTIVSESVTKYHIDLARLYMNNCQSAKAEQSFMKAHECFVRAEQHAMDSSTNREKAYLFEQWAIFKDRSDLTGGALEDTKRIYRAAVRYSVDAKEKSRIAFYRLKTIIESQLIDNPGDMALEREKALLQKLVENFTPACSTMREILKKDPENRDMVFHLVDVQYKVGKYLDAFSNLQSVLDALTAEEIKSYTLANDVVDPIAVTIKAVEAIGSRANFKSVDLMRTVFRELTKSDPTKEADVVPFIGDSSHDMVRPLIDILENETGLNVLHEWNHPFFGARPHEMYEETLPKARCVLILTDTISREDDPDEWYTLEALVGEESIRPLLVYCEPLDKAWERLPRIKHCPRLSMQALMKNDCDESRLNFLEHFLRAVFDNIHVDISDEEED